ncbi:pilus assembly protein PilE [Pseudoxanthomonas broegbernensis]|uniref:Pilus assembly protein PilE n=1 Tax=Pseudoxanthomonas broegbernensis TaxID=83619 RepID=A0A7V8GM37_9GAMM|nr:type IV pilin protein [Pseudoxanthomonas broegbernensis]KAF1686161.1 pilus assembly protein PilE [Pseudoxanthomonas broegbernensis]MBB6063867.1 type IV pilus assembly protein PilE [Pseudoxanthomonas broegbernensis]
MSKTASAIRPAQRPPSSRRARRVRGFTLIELMITVVIVAILVALAYPAYNDHVRKARRAQAKADLVEYAQLAERWHTVNNTYASFDPGVTQSPREGSTVYYAVEVSDLGAATFTITATPQGGQTADRCGTLTINQVGVRGSGDGTARNPECF